MRNPNHPKESSGKSERNNNKKLYNSKNNNRRNNDSSNKNNNKKNNSNNLGNSTTNTRAKTNTTKQNEYRKKKHDGEWFIEHAAAWGDMCVRIDDRDEDTLRVYCQNVNGIFDRDGLGLDEAFHHMRTTKAHVFTFNETHGDDTNPEARNVLRRSKQRLWKNQDGFCTIKTSSSDAAIKGFTKPGGNMVGITGHLCGRVRETIGDEYGRWCGFSVLGRDRREILILTVYNVSQTYAAGVDTLYQQQKSQYLREYNNNNIKSDREEFIDPKKRFVKDLETLLNKAIERQSEIILTGDFNAVLVTITMTSHS